MCRLVLLWVACLQLLVGLTFDNRRESPVDHRFGFARMQHFYSAAPGLNDPNFEQWLHKLEEIGIRVRAWSKCLVEGRLVV